MVIGGIMKVTMAESLISVGECIRGKKKFPKGVHFSVKIAHSPLLPSNRRNVFLLSPRPIEIQTQMRKGNPTRSTQ